MYGTCEEDGCLNLKGGIWSTKECHVEYHVSTMAVADEDDRRSVTVFCFARTWSLATTHSIGSDQAGIVVNGFSMESGRVISASSMFPFKINAAACSESINWISSSGTSKDMAVTFNTLFPRVLIHATAARWLEWGSMGPRRDSPTLIVPLTVSHMENITLHRQDMVPVFETSAQRVTRSP